MKIKELIRMLQDLSPELDVLLSSDEEGNNFGDVAPHLYCDDKTAIIYPQNRKDYEFPE